MQITFDTASVADVKAVRALLEVLGPTEAIVGGPPSVPAGTLVSGGEALDVLGGSYTVAQLIPEENWTALKGFGFPGELAPETTEAPPFSPSTPAPPAAIPAPPVSGPPTADAERSPTEAFATPPFGATLGSAGDIANAPPPSVPTAPSGGPAETTASPSNVDKHGLPWDARIHSGPADKRPMNADGSWRRRRGVEDSLVATVEAELRALMAVPIPSVSELEAGMRDQMRDTPTTVAPPPPLPPAPPVGTGSGAADAGTAISDFGGLMRKLSRLQAGGQITIEATRKIVERLGLPALPALQQRPDLIPAFEAELDAVALPVPL